MRTPVASCHHAWESCMASSCLRLRLCLRLRPQPRPGPGQIDAKVEIMNEKLTTVGTIMSSESYNCIFHVLLSATLSLIFAYRLRRIFCRCNNVNDNGNATMAIMHIIRTARATGVRLAVRLPPASLHDDGW